MIKKAVRSNTTIDAMRIFLIMVIIYLHCQPLLGSLAIENSTIEFIYNKIFAICDLALPVFFAISGFFLFGIKNDSVRFKKFVKLIKTLLWAEALYLLVSFVVGGVGVNIAPFLDIANWINLFTAAVPIPIASGISNLPLWYLVCLSIVSFIMWFAGKYRGKVMIAVAVIGFLIGNLHGAYAGFADSTVVIPILDKIFGTDLDYLTQGFLYISIGYFVHKYQDKIKKLPAWSLTVAIPISFVLFLVEKEFLTTNGFMVPAFVFVTMAFSIASPKLFSKKLSIFASWGAKYSIYMYIFHPIVIFVLNHFLMPIFMPANLLTMIGYWLLVCAVSLIISIGFVGLKDIVVSRVMKIKKELSIKVKKFLA